MSLLPDYSNTVRSVAFSPDGKTLVTANKDTATQLWDVRDPHRHRLMATLAAHKEKVTHKEKSKKSKGCLSTDGTTLATVSNDGTAQLWDVHDPEQPQWLGVIHDGNSEIKAVAFSPDGNTLALGNDDGNAQLWKIRDPRHPSTGSPPGVVNSTPATFFASGTSLWSSSRHAP